MATLTAAMKELVVAVLIGDYDLAMRRVDERVGESCRLFVYDGTSFLMVWEDEIADKLTADLGIILEGDDLDAEWEVVDLCVLVREKRAQTVIR